MSTCAVDWFCRLQFMPYDRITCHTSSPAVDTCWHLSATCWRHLSADLSVKTSRTGACYGCAIRAFELENTLLQLFVEYSLYFLSLNITEWFKYWWQICIGHIPLAFYAPVCSIVSPVKGLHVSGRNEDSVPSTGPEFFYYRLWWSESESERLDRFFPASDTWQHCDLFQLNLFVRHI